MRVHHFCLLVTSVVLLSMSTGCRHISIGYEPAFPKQGDIIKFNVTVGDPGDMENAKVWVDNEEIPVSSGSMSFSRSTCKYNTSSYYTSLQIKGEVRYDDGEVKTTGPETISLTTGWGDRENGSRTYGIYVAHDDDDLIEDSFIDGANEIIDTFDAYSLSKYEWSHPYHFNDPGAPDLMIAMGHGNHHLYAYGPGDNDSVDLSTVALGNFAFCNQYADVDYLVLFFSCLALSMDDYDNGSGVHPFYWYWLNTQDNRLNKRPFMGLHQALGFRTLTKITFSCFGSCSDDTDDFFETFSDYLDGASAVRSAWFWSIEEELDMDDDHNRGAVLFNDHYEHDTIYTAEKDDYIHGSSEYGGHLLIDYHQ